MNSAGASSSTNPSVQHGTGATQPKKRRTNVGKACEPCRRRRCKCDGIRPSCTTCAIYKDECYWEAREDYRKPLSRQQVQALTTRVQDLERLLRENGIDPGTAQERIGVKGEQMEDGQDDFASDGSNDSREWSHDHLVEGETGELQVHGPTSAFRHLGKYSHDSRGSLDIYRDSSPEMPHMLPRGFSRYLPKEVYLTKEQHDIAVDRFFKYYASWGERTNPLLFHHDMDISLQSDVPVKTPHYSPMLHNAILAIALGFSDEVHLQSPSTRKIFAKKAKVFLDHEGMKPSIATVQALAHLASYHSLSAEHNVGWLYIGMALRSGAALGLNMDDAKLRRKGNFTPEQARARNVTFWTTFIQECLWAPYIGRPMNFPEYTTLPPTVDEELDHLPWENKDVSIPGPRPISQPSMISTTFVETVKLLKIGERIMNTLYGIKVDIMSTLLRTGVISEISLSLSTWLENLPPALTLHSSHSVNALPHILMLHLSHAWLVILLHRPFYRPLAGLPTGANTSGTISAANSTAAWAVKQCDKAAVQVIALLDTWHRLHNLRFTPPTALQCCFIAGTTHLLSLASARTPKKQSEALECAQQCIRLMRLMATSWPAAHHQQVLLENLLAEYGLSVVSSRSIERPITLSDRVDLRNAEQNLGPSTNASHLSYKPFNVSSIATVGRDPQGSVLSTGQPPIVTTSSVPFQNSSITSQFEIPLSQSIAEGDTHRSGENMSEGLAFANLALSDPSKPTLTDFLIAPANYATTSNESSFTPYSHSLTMETNVQQTETDWDPSSFGFLGVELDPETQALLDNVLQPHLDVGYQFDYSN